MPRKKRTDEPAAGGIMTGTAPEITTEHGEDIAPPVVKKMGRPVKEIDREEFEKLCQMQCTKNEIAAWFSVDEDTVNNWCHREYGDTFSAVFAQKREGGKASLRRRQWLMSESNPTMAIWLGKQYLGQSDDPSRHNNAETPEERLGKFIGALADAVKQTGGE